MPIKTCIFDAYGTLFDVSAAAREVAQKPGREAFGRVWQKVATDWRLKQLQYTWLRAITGEHTTFWEVTQHALDWALEASRLEDDALREELLALYFTLSAYAEVPKMLETLKENGLETGILSNGSPDMLEGAVKSAGLQSALDAVLSVEDVGVFKPAAIVYDLVEKRFGTAPDEVLFVSSNGWDIAAATGYGFRTVWVNRASEPIDRLPARPSNIMGDLTEIPTLAGSL